MNGAYAYAIVDPEHPGPGALDGLAPGRPMTRIVAGGLAAVAQDVDVAQFEGDGLARNLGDPAWLERTVRAHEDVVESLLGGGPVVPMRFGSIFSSPAALADMLAGHAGELRALLDRVRGRVEWGVKVTADPTRLARRTAAAASAPAGGADYLRRRQAELHAAEDVGTAARELVSDIHLALAGGAEDVTLVTPRRRDPSLVLSAAYLVAEDRADAFLALAAEVRARHSGVCTVDVTGPWPAYSFTSVDVSGPRR